MDKVLLKPISVGRSGFQKLIEPIFDTKIGDILDDFFMKITLKRWVQKFGEMSPEDFKIALQTSKTVSKHHPSNFQKKVLAGFEERMTVLTQKLAATQHISNLNEDQ